LLHRSSSNLGSGCLRGECRPASSFGMRWLVLERGAMTLLSCLVQEGAAFVVTSFAAKVCRAVFGGSVLRPEDCEYSK
jgi:hypothetical protein